MLGFVLRIVVLVAVLSSCGGSSGSSPTVVRVKVAVDGGSTVGTLAPLWRDHYDLSYTHFAYASEPGFVALVDALQPRSWRCSIGRWEVGFPPPPGGDSLDPAVLRVVDREFYRGANTLVAADDPSNYDFTYLDSQLADLLVQGAQPFLCFDYMPFTLSSEQSPMNANNFNVTAPGVPYSTYSFSNGIRTAPPADPAVYARVVRNAIRHTLGLFAGTTDFGVKCFEIGNEPDLLGMGGGPAGFFWTSDRTTWVFMYAAIAAEVDADPALAGIELGGGSFALPPNEPDPTFAGDAMAAFAANATRLDFISFHTYSDDPNGHALRFASMSILRSALGLTGDLVNAEWGRALNGLDSVYDTIEHGIFRAKVLFLMEAFGITTAHEALLRNPGTQAGELGLVHTGPPRQKPVSLCYQALNLLNAATVAIDVTVPAGTFAMAGRSPANDEIAGAVVVDPPASGTVVQVELCATNLPWGAAPTTFELWRVVDGSAAVELRTSVSLSLAQPSVVRTFTAGQGEGGLYVWRLRP